ncbi:MAG: metallophosphoesterase [Scytonematopsis contorta HA4267-MV1]|jgi:Icc-related predicted phosphoesterase|nr:metallophosphoesterase [Scytonematopsis contorta HA4267-MV1]
MRVLSISELPIHQVGYSTAAPGGVGILERQLPFLLGEADLLPNNLEAIIITSDLQGIDPRNQQLLGHLVLEELENLADTGKIPPLKNTGIILAGDLYAQLNKRNGVVGDVREIWQAFNRQFRWVAGVAGNHDSFGNTQEEVQAFKRTKGIYYLDGNIVKNGELNIAGISGIIGSKVTKPFRHNEKDFLRAIRELTKQLPDILVLHEGPDYPLEKLVGKESIRLELEKINSPNNPLIICGHSYWKVPMVVLENGIQVIKADSRVIVLRSHL